MIPEERRRIFMKFLLALWGMATLVLLFCVGILVYEMLDSNLGPWDVAPRRNLGDVSEAPAESGSPTRQVPLYFGSADGCHLVGEGHTLEYTAYTTENCKRALEALIEGPRDILTPVVSRHTRIRGMYMLEAGELVVDLSGDVLSDLPRSASAEALMIYGLVNTLARAELTGEHQGPIHAVRLLVEGASPSDYLPGERRHVEMGEALLPDGRWLDSGELVSDDV